MAFESVHGVEPEQHVFPLVPQVIWQLPLTHARLATLGSQGAYPDPDGQQLSPAFPQAQHVPPKQWEPSVQ